MFVSGVVGVVSYRFGLGVHSPNLNAGKISERIIQ